MKTKCSGSAFLSKGGFTLIELLVVVLVIGILAAVAVPQYKRAVLKSKFSTVMPMAKSLAAAQEVYYLETGEYAQDLKELAVESTEESVKEKVSTNDKLKYVMTYHTELPNVHYIVYQNHSPNFPGNIHCEAKNDDTQAQWLCKDGLGGTKTDLGQATTGYTTYILQGSESDGVFFYTYYDNEAPDSLTDGDTCIGACGGRSYDNGSKCLAKAQGACGEHSTFDHGSSCQAGERWYGCQVNTFNHGSSCIGTGLIACYGSYFYNGSICYANCDSCCQSTHYDSTSYCAGSYCSAGTPAGDKDGIFAGKCWDGNGNYGAAYCPQS